MTIFQTDKELPIEINHWGCYFMSLTERLTTLFSKPFTHETVLAYYHDAQAAKIIDDQVTLLAPQAYCDMVLGINRVVFVGKVDPFYVCEPYDFEILCYHKDGASFNHFVSGDGKGLVLYDPWSSEGSDSVKNGSCIGKRIYRILT